MFFPGNLSQLLNSVYFFFTFELSQMFPVDSCWLSVTLAFLTPQWVGPFLCCEEVVLEDQLVLLVPFALQGNIPWDPTK